MKRGREFERDTDERHGGEGRGGGEHVARLIQTTYLNSAELWSRKFGPGRAELKS